MWGRDLTFVGGQTNSGCNEVTTDEAVIESVTASNSTSITIFYLKPVEAIEISGPSTVELGDIYTYTSQITPENATIKKLQWTVENETGSASVDSKSGALSPISAGTVTLKAEATDGSGVFTTLPITITESIKSYSIIVSNDGNGTSSASLTKAENGQEVTLTATPNEGYQFKEWQSSDVTITNNKFTMPDKDVSVNAVFEKIGTPAGPTITSGNGANYQTGSGEDLSFTCSGNAQDLTGIYVDGEIVSSDNYTVKSGSTILTLKAGYLDTLSAGNHTLRFQYKDNLFAETDFTITAKGNETTATVTAKSPKTGDTTNAAVYCGLLLLSGCAAGITAFRRKKKFNS